MKMALVGFGRVGPLNKEYKLNQQNIIRIKEALEIGYDAAGVIAQRFHEEKRGYREAEHKQVDADAAEIQACITLMERMIAERAVSPAESVQSIDTPEFRKVIDAHHDEAFSYNAEYRDAKLFPEWKDLVVHIDASRAAAHAEGRRSAMEELAKEKDRADRAEAANKDLNANQDAWMRRTHEAEDRANDQLAARDCMRWALEQIAVGDAKFPLQRATDALVQAGLWSATAVAQPLRQEGGKDLQGEIMRLTAQLAIAEHRAKDWRFAAADWLEEKANEQEKTNAKYPEHVAAYPSWESRIVWMRLMAMDLRSSSAQPSDNLQQASTAQVEWITCLRCQGNHNGVGADGVENDCPKCENGMVRVMSAFRTELTDAELSDPEFTRAYIEGCNESFAEAMDEIKTLRAALAATTAAEPIIWIDADAAPHEDQGELIDGIHQITLLGSTQGPFGRYTTPLYRAAPPQQVDTGGLPG
jgi:hypothetical protein